MDKFFGAVGYGATVETKLDVWEEQITERSYFGDVLQYYRRLDPGMAVNSDVDINNKISIVADPFAYENFHAIRYVQWNGVKWKVSNIEVQYPRLILTLGGVYHENTS